MCLPAHGGSNGHVAFDYSRALRPRQGMVGCDVAKANTSLMLVVPCIFAALRRNGKAVINQSIV